LDRRRARSARLGAAALAVAILAAGALAASDQPPLRALRWLAPEADATRGLSTTPGECLAPPADPEAALAVEVGRAAFRDPMVLGGQAARAGVACETCHRSGRNNPDFLFPGISGAAGTADVTSSLFSSHRGDGIDDPRPIPDLGGPKAALKVAQAPQARALEPFIHGLVVEEFDGPEPPASVLAGLAAYVRALNPAACPAAATQALTPEFYLDDARRAVRTAETLAGRGDRDGALVMVAAGRARLGLIDERYPGPALADQRSALRRSDAALAAAAQALRTGDRRAPAALARWRAQSRGLEALLARGKAYSLFNPARLALAARRPLPRKAS
jgi:hypothetical protein